MLEQLKQEVYEANMELVAKGVVIYTWGNASGIDSSRRYVVIKPSGIEYESMKADDMVVVELMSGKVVEGRYKPSSDTPTHLELYKSFTQIGGVVHTHSTNAVAFAQAGADIPALGTTHADYFHGNIPCTRRLSPSEVEWDYELNTGKVIVESFFSRHLDPEAIPGVIVKNHGPFTWGINAKQAAFHAVVLEHIAEMAFKTISLNHAASMATYILDKHFARKHGPNAYYGQK